jgi:hypothetical protein
MSQIASIHIALAARITCMTNTGAVVALLLIGVPSTLASPMQSGTVQVGRLDPRIGAAAPKRYASVRDAKDWQNPYLVIRRDGIEVIAKQLPTGRKTVAAVELERTLVGLPVTAWPYGRVAAVQENGVRAAGGSDDVSIPDNLSAALATLKKLDIAANRWPSA